MMKILIFLVAPVLLSAIVKCQGCQKPQNYPPNMSLDDAVYENWSREIRVGGVFRTTPESPDDIVTLADWARANRYNLRPLGLQRSWSPLAVPLGKDAQEDSQCKKVILIDTENLSGMELNPKNSQGFDSVTVGTGAVFDDLAMFLESKGYQTGFIPSLGDATIGGLLATGSHGTGWLPNDKRAPGEASATLGNLILEAKVVIWNPRTQKYELIRIQRSDPRMASLMTGLGRIFITEVTLRVIKNERYRCLSRTDISVKALFAKPKKDGSSPRNSISDLVSQTGYVGIIHFPFTNNPWVRLWSKSPKKPDSSKEVTGPYNFIFQENLPDYVSDIISSIQGGNSILTPITNNLMSSALRLGLIFTRTQDLWGWSKDVFLVVKTSAPKVSVSSFTILTSRPQLQQTLFDMYTIYDDLVKAFQRRLKYPMNAPIEVRITNVDDPKDVGGGTAQVPAFSPASPLEKRSELDTVIWLDVTTFSKTDFVIEFYNALQNEFYQTFNGTTAFVRPEWSKRWGYAQNVRQPWTNQTLISSYPEQFSNWKQAAEAASKMDEPGVFVNGVVQSILP